MKILECANCGAPLKAKLFGSRIKCNYCGIVNEKEKLATLHEEKPKNFSAPKEWKPPPDKKVSRKPLPYKRDSGDWFLMIYLPAIVLLLGGGAAMDAWGGNFYGVVPSDLAHLNVVGPPAAVGKQLQGADVDAKSVIAAFRTGSAGPFKSLRFDWSASHMGAPEFLILETVDSKATPPADVEARLSSDLPGGLDAQGNWRFGAVQVQFRKDSGGGIEITVDPHPNESDNPLAARQAAVAMHVIAHAAFNLPLGVDPAEMRAVFGGGYPVASMLKIEPATRVDKAPTLMKGLFPGASVHGYAFDIGLDHPLLSLATVEWDDPDEHGGRLRKVSFVPTAAYHDRRDAFVACLAKTLGPMKTNPEKKGAPDYDFDLAKFPVEASFELLANDVVQMDAFDLFPADKWHDVFSAIDACR